MDYIQTYFRIWDECVRNTDGYHSKSDKFMTWLQACDKTWIKSQGNCNNDFHKWIKTIKLNEIETHYVPQIPVKNDLMKSFLSDSSENDNCSDNEEGSHNEEGHTNENDHHNNVEGHSSDEPLVVDLPDIVPISQSIDDNDNDNNKTCLHDL